MLNNSYWSIDDVLMSEEPVTCKWDMKCPFLSILQSNKFSSSSVNYIEGEEVQIPITIACSLAELGAITIEAPAFFTEKYYHFLQVDPTIADWSKNKYYYEKCNLLFPYWDLDHKWVKCLIRAIFLRFFYYYNHSQNVQIVNSTIQNHSCNIEMRFFIELVKINNNIQFFKENYSNNNKVWDDKWDAKKIRIKLMKNNNS